jgi:hypothetical protein
LGLAAPAAMATSVDGFWRIKKYGTHGASETLAGAFNAHRKSPSLVEASGDPLGLGKQMGDARRLMRMVRCDLSATIARGRVRTPMAGGQLLATNLNEGGSSVPPSPEPVALVADGAGSTFEVCSSTSARRHIRAFTEVPLQQDPGNRGLHRAHWSGRSFTISATRLLTVDLRFGLVDPA